MILVTICTQRSRKLSSSRLSAEPKCSPLPSIAWRISLAILWMEVSFVSCDSRCWLLNLRRFDFHRSTLRFPSNPLAAKGDRCCPRAKAKSRHVLLLCSAGSNGANRRSGLWLWTEGVREFAYFMSFDCCARFLTRSHRSCSGTYHFRTTILPPEDVFAEVVDKYEHFNKEFMAQYRD